MFSFIDKRLCTIKRNHNKLFGNLDVLITSDLHQVRLVHYSWVFHSINDGLNSINAKFWQDKIKCYELYLVVHQQDE
jgi:hypothetical protein